MATNALSVLALTVFLGVAPIIGHLYAKEIVSPEKHDYEFVEEDGLVCMEGEHASVVCGFQEVQRGESGTAVEALQSEGDIDGMALRFDFTITKPGDYYIWVLGHCGTKNNRTQKNFARDELNTWMDRTKNNCPAWGASKDSKETPYLDGKQSPVWKWDKVFFDRITFQWSNKSDYNLPNGQYFKIGSAGHHHIELRAREGEDATPGEWGVTVDKVVLTLNNKDKPSGKGPAETLASTSVYTGEYSRAATRAIGPSIVVASGRSMRALTESAGRATSYFTPQGRLVASLGHGYLNGRVPGVGSAYRLLIAHEEQ
jgi:hypothetical protein